MAVWRIIKRKFMGKKAMAARLGNLYLPVLSNTGAVF
jgi:hypothetical protein